MPTRTGTASQVDASAGNGSTSVTVPAGANGAIAFWAHWDNDGGSTLSGLTLGGNAFTTRSQLAEGATAGESGAGVATLTSLPAAGSQTLAWTWSAGAARSEGGEIVIVWIQDMNTSDPFRDAKTDAGTGSGNVSVAPATDPSDLLIAFAQRFTGGNPVLDGSVFIDNVTVNQEVYDVSEVTPGAGSTTVNMSGEDYSSMAAISLKAAGGVAATFAAVLGAGATMAAALSTAIQMSAALSGSGAIAGALTTQIRMAAALSATGTMAGALTTAIRMAATLSASGTMSAALATAIRLDTQLSASGTMSADLAAGSSGMSASLSASGAMAAALATQIRFAAALSGSGTITAPLSTGIRFSASLSGSGVMNASLATQIRFAASIAAQATMSGALAGGPATFSALLLGSGTLSASLVVGAPPAFGPSPMRAQGGPGPRVALGGASPSSAAGGIGGRRAGGGSGGRRAGGA